MEINEIISGAYKNSVDHGFHESGVNIPEALALIHSEVSEALECYRVGDMITLLSQTDNAEPKPFGFPSELADIVIRVCDLAGALGIDLDQEIVTKMAYNKTRPHKHGKVC